MIETIKLYTCDLCHSRMDGEYDTEIFITTRQTDVGSSTISGRLAYNQAYGCSNGIICRACKKKWLTKYIETL